MDDLDDLLTGSKAPMDFVANGSFSDPIQELPDHTNIDISLEQSLADFTQGRFDIGRGQPALASEPGEDVFETVRDGVEHGELS
jgi:hypothetical protein